MEVVEYDQRDEQRNNRRLRVAVDKKRKLQPNISNKTKEECVHMHILPKLNEIRSNNNSNNSNDSNANCSLAWLDDTATTVLAKKLCDEIPVGYPVITPRVLEIILKKEEKEVEAQAQRRQEIEVQIQMAPTNTNMSMNMNMNRDSIGNSTSIPTAPAAALLSESTTPTHSASSTENNK